MTEHRRRPLLNYALGLMCLAAILAGVLVVGPASSSQAGASRTAKVVEGVVLQTVSGSGNLEPASQLDLGFKTGGTVTHIYVHQGQHVVEGQLLATLDPQSAEVTLEQAKAALMAAEASLAREQESGGEGSSASGASSGGAGSDKTPSNPSGTPSPASKSGESGERASPEAGVSKEKLSAATREANLASARAAVKSDELTVHSDEAAVQNTKLYAPMSGTIVSLSGQVGEVVSASGTTRASSSSGSGASGAAASTSGRSGTGSSASGSSSSGAGSGSGSSSAFAVLSDLSSMKLVVALSESEIGNVHPGQIATITVEALEGRKLAAHVSEVATLATSSSGVVSYDVTFTLDQMTTGLKPGMSATAEVVVKQAEGVNVPTSAITGGTVTVVRGGKDMRERVVTGLAGDSSTIVLSGLKAGETVVLPQALSASSATSLTSRLSSRLRGAGGGGGGLGGGGFAGGGPVFFRGGG